MVQVSFGLTVGLADLLPPVCSMPDTTRNNCPLLRRSFGRGQWRSTRKPRLQSLAVNNNDPTPASLNYARLFELTGDQSNRRPPHPQHLRKELLGQGEDIGIDPIPSLEQPTG